MKFPVRVKHRKIEAVIYGKTKAYAFYRLAYQAAGKRHVRSFATYGEALEAANDKVRELSAGNQSAGLTAKESAAALVIRDALDAFRLETGRTVTALQAVTKYLDAAKLLGERPLGEAVEAYLATVASVTRKDVAEAVEKFIALRAPKAEAWDGKRSAMNPKYVENTANWLREFAATFPATAVCDLSKDHLNAYMQAHGKLSAKSRNDRRVTVRMFMKWCMRRDYLPATHRLLEADGLTMEARDAAPIDYYRPAEFRALLEKADEQMRPIIALQGLAGLRLEEALRLDWRDVFGIPGHVEVSSSKSKTRQRRLVEICPALEEWLSPHRGAEGKLATQWQTVNGYVQGFLALRKSLRIPARRNGLRHGFVTFHFAAHSNENLTSALAGNSPAMIHAHYKGLATKAEAEKWFAVAPGKAENLIPLKAAAKE